MSGTVNEKIMEKEFEDYWLKHQKKVNFEIAKELERRVSWVYALRYPDGLGMLCIADSCWIILQPRLNFESWNSVMGRGFACCGCAFCATSDGQALSAKEKDYDSGIGCY